MRFSQAVPRERGEIQVKLPGDVAWAYSTSITQGRIGDREINSQGAELMVLGRSRRSAGRPVSGAEVVPFDGGSIPSAQS